MLNLKTIHFIYLYLISSLQVHHPFRYYPQAWKQDRYIHQIKQNICFMEQEVQSNLSEKYEDSFHSAEPIDTYRSQQTT